MAKKKLDIGVLQGALGMFAVCLLIAGLMLAASFYFRDQMNREYQSHQMRFRDISRQYLSVDVEERIIVDYLPAFRNLYQRGVLGPEQRLSWLEALKLAGDEVKPPKLGYQIQGQTNFAAEFPVNTGGFDIRTSDMELSMGLLHEGDLFAVLSTLDDHAAGLFSVSECDLVRANFTARSEALSERLEAVCQLRWFTLDLKGPQGLRL